MGHSSRWAEEYLQPCGTPAAARRHQRRGERACDACLAAARIRNRTTPQALSPDYREIRNGLPFRPYVYRGSGADAYTGEIVQ